LKFVLLWALFIVIGLIFDVISQAWRTATSGLYYAANAWMSGVVDRYKWDDKRGDRARRWRNRFSQLGPGVLLFPNPLPDILRWSIQLSIFVVLLGPLFDEIEASFGSKVTFADVLQQAEHLHIFAAMFSIMKRLLFGA
jgi:hypothetical protein